MRLPLLAFVAAASTLSQSDAAPAFRISAGEIAAHIRVLASDEMAGRGNGTRELEQAAAYIAGQFKAAGLEPGGDHGRFLQAFDITTGLRADRGHAVTVSSPTGSESLGLGIHYYPLSVPGSGSPGRSATGRQTDSLVFAGYGISAPAFGYDDYAGLDVDGKAVIVFTHEPQEHDARSVFDGRRLTPHSDIAHKAALASRRGATVLIVVDDPSHMEDRVLTLPQAWVADPQVGEFQIPVIRVGRMRLQRLLAAVDFDETARAIDRTLTPRSRALAGATLSYSQPLVTISPRVHNVIGILPGSDPARTREAVVVGAHYDHVGLGEPPAPDSMDAGRIHNGADDNASGTAVMMAMAHAAARERARFRRSIVFAAFAGEEVGLVGSRHYMSHPSSRTPRPIAMINLDMVGRARGRVLVGGLDPGGTFKPVLEELRRTSRLRLDGFREGYRAGASDNDAFERANVPTLLFFTGFHADYHRPSDDAHLIDEVGAAEIGRLALMAAWRATVTAGAR